MLFTDDRRMARLNEGYLGRRGPTNVLAFPMAELAAESAFSPMLGDVVISLDTARRESAEAGRDLEETVDRLLVHGLLHLLGYDHERSETEASRMEQEEERLRQLMSEAAGGPQRKRR